MNRRKFLTASLGLLAAARLNAAPKRRPNVVFFLADDLGWMDTSLYGSQYYETPNIERLAKRGMMFSNAYAANPLCSPTRASILTGKFPCRLHITTPAGHLPPQPDVPLLPDRARPWQKVVCPRGKRFLPHEEVTLAEVFREAGYQTAFIGKWHLGHEPWWPKTQGFDVNIAGGHYPGPPSYFSPYRIKTLPDGPKGEYITDRLTREAVRYLDDHHRGQEPFFLCFWHYAVHAPFQAKKELIEKYSRKTDPRGKQNCPTMGGMIQSLDESLGRLLDKIDALGIADDTIIIFMSDNGGNMYNRVEGVTPTNNAPLRNGKGSIYEGGHREPCLVVWPGAVRPGSRSDTLISSIDFYPTLLEMTGVPDAKGHKGDGISIVPALQGKPLARDTLFCHFPHYIPATDNLPSTAVRQGDWKLIRIYGEGPELSPAHELYNLRDDIGETANLAAKFPEKVEKLDALITRHLEATGALVPFPNPNYDPTAPRGGSQAKPVAGWHPSKQCELSVKQGMLHVKSIGGDPYLYAALRKPAVGPVTLEVRMRCKTGGQGQAFWTTQKDKNFHSSRRITFPIVHDDGWRELKIALPAKGKVTSVRIDPGAAKGLAVIDWVRVRAADGAIAKTWEF